MRLTITHTTDYYYENPHSYGLQRLRVSPVSAPGLTVLNWDLDLSGARQETDFYDQHGNKCILTSLEPGERHIRIHAFGEVETRENSGILGSHFGHAPLWYYLRPTALTKPGAEIKALAKALDGRRGSAIECCHALSSQILEKMIYRPGETAADTTAEAALASGHGVCQDHTQVFLAAARLLGFPARYVSGYLMMNDRVVQDASHAWAEVHLDDLGWVGFDISNGISPDERYVRVAAGLDYRDAAPVSGMRFGDEGGYMLVEVQVQQ